MITSKQFISEECSDRCFYAGQQREDTGLGMLGSARPARRTHYRGSQHGCPVVMSFYTLKLVLADLSTNLRQRCRWLSPLPGQNVLRLFDQDLHVLHLGDLRPPWLAGYRQSCRPTSLVATAANRKTRLATQGVVWAMSHMSMQSLRPPAQDGLMACPSPAQMCR